MIFNYDVSDLQNAVNAIDDLNIKKNLGSTDDLDTLYGTAATGVYYIGSDVPNTPVAYRPLIVIGSGSDGFQLIYGTNTLLTRMRTNNTWGEWSNVWSAITPSTTDLSGNVPSSVGTPSNLSVTLIGKCVRIDGAITISTSAAGTGAVLVQNIPSSCRPTQSKSFRAWGTYNGTQSWYTLAYQANGTITTNIGGGTLTGNLFFPSVIIPLV